MSTHRHGFAWKLAFGLGAIWLLLTQAGVGRLAGAEPPAAETATLNILSPDGAAIFLGDGKDPEGYAPKILGNLPANKPVTVRLELAGHQPLERTFTLAPGRVENWEPEMMPNNPGIEITTLAGAEIVAIDEQKNRIALGVADEKGVLASAGRIVGATCTLEISKAGYETLRVDAVKLDPRHQVKVTFQLRPKAGHLEIVSVPVVSEIFINGEKKALTRGLVEVPPETELAVEIRAAGYRTKQQKVKLALGEQRPIDFGNLELVSGSLRVAVTLGGAPVRPEFHAKARLFVDGKEYAWNRGVIVGLPPGKHSLELVHDTYETGDAQPVEIKENVNAEVTMVVTVKPVHVQIAVSPNVPFSVRLDGTPLEGHDGVYDIAQLGAFTLEVAAANYKPASQRFENLAAGATVPWNVTLEVDKVAMQRQAATEEHERIAREEKNFVAQLEATIAEYRQKLPDQSATSHFDQPTYERGTKQLAQITATAQSIPAQSAEVTSKLTEFHDLLQNHKPVVQKPKLTGF